MVEEMLTGLSAADREEFVRLLTMSSAPISPAQREQEKAANG